MFSNLTGATALLVLRNPDWLFTNSEKKSVASLVELVTLTEIFGEPTILNGAFAG